MRTCQFFLSLAIVSQLFSSAAFAQLTDGQCTVPLDAGQFAFLSDDAFLQEDPAFAIAAPLTSTAPVTDGLLGAGEYENMCYFTFAENENPGQSWPNLDNLDDGDADLTAFMHFSHDEEFLYVAFDVTDDWLDLDEPANSFQNDGVELFFNPDNDSGDAWGTGKFQVYVDAAGDGDVEFNNRGATAGITHAFEYPPVEGEVYTAGLVKEDESGYVVEYVFPLASLDRNGGDGELLPMATGDVFLMNAAIDDNDEDDNTDAQTGHHLLWHVDGAGSPFGGGEEIWTVPLLLADAVAGGVEGDLNDSGARDAGDIDVLSAAIAANSTDGQFDLNGDGAVDGGDRTHLVNTLMNTFLGDSNLDGEFNSGDFVSVFTSGEYEDGIAGNSTWATGDWNGDGDFDSGDFVAAFTEGAYEQGPGPGGFMPTPEPSATILLAIGLLGFLTTRRR